MPVHRRLTALAAAACLLGATLVGVVPAVAQAAPAAAAAASAAPRDTATYYAGTEGLTGATLAAELHSIIQGHTRLSYAQLWEALPRTDADPQRSGYLLSIYSGTSILVADQCGSGSCAGKWNREHTWPQSQGDFGTAAGIGTDLFHMRPEFADTNSSRGNLDYDDGGSTGVASCTDCRRDADSFEPRAEVKGDLARGILYMAVRYEGDDGLLDLKVNDLTCNESGAPNMGKLSTLVSWSAGDPPDARELARNELIDSEYQHNRNPFIDHPEWVSSVFGTGVGRGPACGSTAGSDYAPGGTTGNRAPSASPVSATGPEDQPVTVALAGTDPDGDPLTWSLGQVPATGTATLSGSTLTWTPARDTHGTVSVGVTASDGRGGTASTTATITVTPVDDAPVAADVTASTGRGARVDVALAASDVDDATSTLTYAVATPPQQGTATISGGTATYTPPSGFTGTETFTYVARDPAGATSAPATVRVEVTATPRAPVARPVSAITVEDEPVTFVLPASDPDGDAVTRAVATPPSHGTVTIAGDSATYVPARDFSGTDAFTFTASDGRLTSSPASASITVVQANRDPVITAIPALRVTAGSPSTFTVPASDPDGDPVTVTALSAPARGSAAVSGARDVTYVPSVRSGSDDFTVTVSDGRGGTASARVEVVVQARTATVTLGSATVVRGGTATLTATVTAPGGPRPTGAVVLFSAGGTFARAALVDGVATFPAAAARAGTTSMSATYGGDALFGVSSSAPATLTVTRAAASLALTVGPRRGKQAGVVRVAVRPVAGITPTGRVSFRVAGATKAVSLVDGRARFRLPKALRASRPVVAVRYAGDAEYLPASARTRRA